MRTVLASPLLEVAVGSDPRTISFGGPDLVQAEPLRFLTEGRWPAGPLPPPDDDPGPGGGWRHAGRALGAVEVAVNLAEIPVYLRAGATLPLLPDHVRSLSPYAGAAGV